MDNLDKVRARQKAKSEKAEKKQPEKTSAKSSEDKSDLQRKQTPGTDASKSGVRKTVTPGAAAAGKGAPKKRRRRRKKSKYSWIFTTLKIIFLVFLIAVIGIGIWVFSVIDFSFGDDLSSMNLNISSKVYYINENGEAVQYAQFNASENRIWVPIDKMPKNMKNAIVAIEDQRFYEHHGVDLRRTAGAAMNYVFKGDSSYGGSTITQQLVKNITADKDRDASRKIREITRAVVLETKLSKDQILEMYLNTIYLSQGANGVEAAANIYFSKTVSELSLSECACIAGITQYPAEFDPITHPEANERKRKLVLEKMLELEYISQKEYDAAVKEKIVLHQGEVKQNKIQSYFLDELFEEVQKDLIAKGYTEQFATNMIYNGGLKIYCTVNPEIQRIMEEYFEDDSNFNSYAGETQPQAAMIITDPTTGEIKGIVGGRGEKSLNRGLNRATQTKRQPGSSIKPIAVYAPAIDQGVITPSTSVDDSPLKIGDWTPKNSGGNFRGFVSVKTAVTWSYNIPAVRVLEEVTVDKSFDYMKNKLHVDSLVESKHSGGKEYSDKTLPSLALGGLTDGVTLLEMNGAYATFANQGNYIEPHTYTRVYSMEGKVLLDKKPTKNQAFSPSTAYMMNDMLKSVVREGTGSGAQLSNMDTCGKTGTTDNNKDRWFIGYSPYYVGSVWFGYDKPQSISASNNPALVIWEDIMSEIHKPLPSKHFEKPDSIVERTVCQRTGLSPADGCPTVYQMADKTRSRTLCKGNHEYIGTKPYKSIENDDEDSGSDEEGEPTGEDLPEEDPPTE